MIGFSIHRGGGCFSSFGPNARNEFSTKEVSQRDSLPVNSGAEEGFVMVLMHPTSLPFRLFCCTYSYLFFWSFYTLLFRRRLVALPRLQLQPPSRAQMSPSDPLHHQATVGHDPADVAIPPAAMTDGVRARRAIE